MKIALLACLLGLALAPSLVACTPKESIVMIGDGKKLSADEIDADPLALLPGGAVFVGQVDVSALLASSLGPQTLRAATSLVPLTPEMNFEPKRDLKTIHGGAYSMQSADFAAVARGDFDPDAIKAAADRGALSAIGRPLQKTSYGGNDLYLTGDVGFVVLTRHSLLIGNPAGLRRALDRLRDARIKREIPDWVAELLKTPGAEVVIAGDMSGQSVSAAVSQQVPMAQKLGKARMIGDFKDPGMNLGGALTYEDAAAAASAHEQIRSMGAQAGMLNLLFFVGISNPLRDLKTNLQGNDVQVVARVDGPVIGALLERLATQLRDKPAAPAPTPSSSVR